MKGLWLEDQRIAVRDDLPIPTMQEGEALIQVWLAGICSTDLEMLDGYYPFTGILGHEFVGEVAACDTDPRLIGQRVVGEINVTCGECPTCLEGHPTHCERRNAIGIKGHDGVFAQYLSLPMRNMHRVPDSVPDEAAVFTEPLAAALEIQQQVHVRPGERVLVIGAGRLGQLAAQTLVLTGCELWVMARHTRQRELLAGMGVKALSEGQIPGRMDLVVEATGTPQGFALARQAVKPRGTIVLKSTYHGTGEFNLSSLVVDEITLVGSRCGPFEPALRLLEGKRVNPIPLIDGQYPLEQGLQAFEAASKPGGLKVLLKP